MKKHKSILRLFSLLLIICMCLDNSLSVFAIENAEETFDDLIIESTESAQTVLADTRLRGNLVIGEGTLTVENPLFGNYKGYAKTESYDSAYKVRAKCDVNSNGVSTETTGWQSASNTKEVSTAKISATNSRCIFDGFHEIQQTSSSSTASAQTTLKYNQP